VDAAGVSGPSYDELAALVVAQREQIDAQAGLIEVLRARVAELERRLGMNSRNSSKPPSSDGLAKPPPRSLRERSGRRAGKQPGAEGSALSLVDDPDEVLEHRADVCGGCAAGLGGARVVSVARRQVFEVPALRLRVVEHRVLSCRCGCGVVTAGSAPVGVTAPAQYGPGVGAIAAYLSAAHHLPVERTARIMADLWGVRVSTGWVWAVLGRVADATTGFHDRLLEVLAAAPVVHFDETAVRVVGRNRWVHVACTGTLTSYHLDDKRGHTAIDTAGILPRMRAPQVAVHDGWLPYAKACYTPAVHALCNAHHLRELVGWFEHDPVGNTWAGTMATILREANRAVNTARARGSTRLDQAVLDDFGTRWQNAITAAYAAHPPPAGSRRGLVLALIDRMRGYTTEIWRFAHDFTVPFDNNQAERDIRMLKTKTKVSGGWRTIHGAHNWLRIRSYISTLHKNNIHILTGLQDALTGNPWLPTT
jgi:transposase